MTFLLDWCGLRKTARSPIQVRVTYGRTDERYSEHLAGYTANAAVHSTADVVESEPAIVRSSICRRLWAASDRGRQPSVAAALGSADATE
jgi:hypothetical protein